MSEEIWLGDKLNRKTTADFLTNYLTSKYEVEKDSSDGSFVLAINADWGFGKTFLLQNWQEDLAKGNTPYPTVYFDAWKNDYTSEPLVGFIAEINEAFKSYFSSIPDSKDISNKFQDLVYAGKKMIRPAFNVLSQVAIKKFFNMSMKQFQEALQTDDDFDEDNDDTEEETGNKGENSEKSPISTLVSKCVDAAFVEHTNKKKAIKLFKRSLDSLVRQLEQQGIKLPIFIFIDELDRCRPSYAVELLENIKHLFGVRGVYFIVATNVRQLSHSVSVLYGSEFDSERYLKRFFDQEYVLPAPDHYKFSEHLFEKYQISKIGILYTGIPQDLHQNQDLAIMLFAKFAMAFRLGLRDLEQIVAALKAAMLVYKPTSLHAAYLYFLLMLRNRHSKKYDLLVKDSGKIDPNAVNLGEIMDTTITVKAFTASQHGGFSDTEVSLDTIIRFYLSHANLDLVELSANAHDDRSYPYRLIREILRELPHSYSPGKLYPSTLQNYPQLVAQAGQLLS